MLSRRNVRIKILQLFYSRSIIGNLTDREIIAKYRRMLDDTYDLYIFSLYLMYEVAKESEADFIKRSKKHLPTDDDKVFTAKLFSNPLITSLGENENLQELFVQLKFRSQVDKDLVRQIYLNYMKEEDYIAYASDAEEGKSDLDALLDFYRYLRKNEIMEEILEDRYHAWLDDKSLIVGAMKKTIKAMPVKVDFLNAYKSEDQTTEDFGMTLLLGILEDEEEIMGYIEPKLQNWDADRLARLDMIILKMAICEMIKFPSIPTKATINEYVEIAKNYSTDKSKEFVNGILDTLMKDLVEKGIVVKIGRGLK